MEDSVETKSIYCTSEYTSLQYVIVTPPAYMEIKDIMNETQKHYKHINRPLAIEQHQHFVKVLKDNNVHVIELPAMPRLNEQVFTRDIGFSIGEQLFIGNMKEPLRRGETTVLKKWCDDQAVTYHQLECDGSIEGGDVIVDESTVWIGKSGRTSIPAIEELRAKLPSYQVHTLDLKEGVLHLDCALNVLSDTVALVYPKAFSTHDFNLIKERFDIISVTDDEYFKLGPNVLSIGSNKVLSLKQNKRINHLLESKGFNIIGIDFSEIIKSGGSFRCCSLPLVRGQAPRPTFT